MHTTITRLRRRGIAFALTAAATIGATTMLAATPAQAATATATATLSGGSLMFLTPPPDVSFAATLNGTNQTPTATQPLDVGDGRGSGAGWNITATSTTFIAGALTLATTATTIASAPSPACDSGSTCTLASTNVSFPYTLPAATVAPTATKMFNAPLNTGMGNETVTPTWTLSVPASTIAGTYTSTWTLSLTSGP